MTVHVCTRVLTWIVEREVGEAIWLDAKYFMVNLESPVLSTDFCDLAYNKAGETATVLRPNFLVYFDELSIKSCCTSCTIFSSGWHDGYCHH